MIIDKISKMDRYAYIPGVQKAVDFLKNTDLNALEKGTIDLGDGHCVKVMFYDTKALPEEDISLEAHRNYLDLQMTFGGEETMYFQAIDLGEEDKPYHIVELDKYVFPVFFLYRHSVELFLKSIACLSITNKTDRKCFFHDTFLLIKYIFLLGLVFYIFEYS